MKKRERERKKEGEGRGEGEREERDPNLHDLILEAELRDQGCG